LMEFEFDYLLFSGGGNDVVGRYDFDFFIRNKEDGFDWEDCIRKDRVGLKIDQIDSAYRTLCELTTEYSSNPNITIITHTYERLTPIDEGFALFDLIPLGKAWLHPFMVKKNIADPDDQRRIVGFILNEFKNALFGVANDYGVGRVYETERDTNRALFNVVDTWDTVLAGEWRNEIHPTSDGFEKVAQKIYDEQIAE
ncbi:MAG: peptidase C14, partial [Rhodospirillaceae bacterium]|nr:peptidase C14 [Rhodospirillaceae bacterium]